MEMFFSPVSKWAKQSISIIGLLMTIGGLAIGLVVLLLVLIMVAENDSDAITVGLVGSTMTLLMLGTGVATFWHGVASMEGKVSKPFQIPAIWKLLIPFGICIILGQFVFQGNIAPGLFLPLILLIAGLLPSLVVLSLWGIGDSKDLSWRRCLIVICWGTFLATVAFSVAQIGWFMISKVFLDSASVSNMLEAIGSNDTTSWFAQMVLIFPVIVLLAAPLAAVPWLKTLSQQDTFLLGAVSGAGVTWIATVIFISIEPDLWLWMLFFQFLGCAVLPLSAGLVALGWQSFVREIDNAFVYWLALFGMAFAIFTLWSLGLMIVLGAIGLEPRVPPAYYGVTSPILIFVGLSIWGGCCLWAGRSLVVRLSSSKQKVGLSTKNELILEKQTVAVWAIVCVIAIAPAGFVILRLL